jgi:uncharacterized surface protein with fasciclin (FAS1) repeats
MELLMSKRFTLIAAAAALALAAGAVAPLSAESMQEKTVNVGGAPMYPSKNIIQNAVNSKDHTTLVAAVKAAGLVDILSGPGPFTVFAPTNEAFAKLPAGTVDTLLKPENKATLVKILTYHVVPGRMSDQGRRRRSQAQDRLRRLDQRQAGRPRQAQHHRRQGRRRHGHDPRRSAVEWRDPRDRHRAAADVIGRFSRSHSFPLPILRGEGC